MAWIYSQKMNDAKKAIELYEKVISVYPDYEDMPNVIYSLAVAYGYVKDYAKSFATYQQVIDRWPNTEIAAQAGHTKGMAYYYQGECQQAIAEFRKVADNTQAETDKWKGSSLFWIGQSYLNMKRYDDAVAAFQERLDRFGPLDEAQYMIAETYRQAERFSEAISAFKKLVEEYPDYQESDTALYFVGELLEMEGKLQQATEAYEQVIRKYPDSDGAKAAQYRIKMIETGQDPLVHPSESRRKLEEMPVEIVPLEAKAEIMEEGISKTEEPLSLKWKLQLNGRLLTHCQISKFRCENPPSVVDGIAYLVVNSTEEAGCSVYAIDINSGEVKWAKSIKEYYAQRPLIIDNKAILGLRPGLLGMALSDGDVELKKRILSDTHTAPVTDGKRIYTDTDAQGELIAFEPDSLNIVWKIEVEHAIGTPLFPYKDSLYFGCHTGHIYKINSDNGEVEWCALLSEVIPAQVAMVGHDIVLICSSPLTKGVRGLSYQTIGALKAETGRKLWIESFEEIISYPKIEYEDDSANVYICSGKRLYCLDIVSGKIRWTFKPDGKGKLMPWDENDAISLPVITRSTVYVACGDNQIFAMEKNTGQQLWSYTSCVPVPLPPHRLKEKPWPNNLNLYSYPYNFKPFIFGDKLYVELSGEYEQQTKAHGAAAHAVFQANAGIPYIFVLNTETGTLTAKGKIPCIGTGLPVKDRNVLVTNGNQIYLLVVSPR
jgi:outer membrane protein assembly factor BamB/TolA-binding protein